MRHIVIGTAGHIDHGKSALVRALTGVDPDRLKEEKARGITIDLGFAHVEVDGTDVAFVDVPGHERFVKNMLAGATGIDAVLLVVAADESVMPQTREHFDICRLLKVGAGLIVLTKADLVDADTLELATLEVREMAAGSFLADAPVIAVSSKTGQGLDGLRDALRALPARIPDRAGTGPVRLAIDRVFSVRGFGSVVTGTLSSGALHVDDALELLPSARAVKVRGLQGHGRTIETAGPGQRVAVNLAGLEVGDIARGETLATPGSLAVTRRFDAAIDVLASARALRHGARMRFHHGTSELLGRIAIAAAAPSHADLADGVPSVEVPPGGRAWVRVRLEAPAVLTRGDRFILRAYSPQVTVAGGVVLDPLPAKSAIRTVAGRARLARLDISGVLPFESAPHDIALAQVLDELGGTGLTAGELTSRLGLAPGLAGDVWKRASLGGRAVIVGERLVGSTAIEVLSRRLLDRLAEHHRAQPLSEGMPREEARERVFSKVPTAVFDSVLETLGAKGEIAGRDRISLASHRVAYSAGEQRALALVEQAFLAAALTPPEPRGLAESVGLRAEDVDRAVRVLLRQKTLSKVETLFFHAGALDQLKRNVVALGPGAMVDVASFKQRYGLSRKYAIPLLEYLDRERVTRRVGEGRVVL